MTTGLERRPWVLHLGQQWISCFKEALLFLRAHEALLTKENGSVCIVGSYPSSAAWTSRAGRSESFTAWSWNRPWARAIYEDDGEDGHPRVSHDPYGTPPASSREAENASPCWFMSSLSSGADSVSRAQLAFAISVALMTVTLFVGEAAHGGAMVSF